ncbi:hypothetical protein RD110_12310 [Rhodoferax koreense]|uniref:Uncharacterized protein n=1 Tax=Rhodoferax koreensis TaxID=1842727 RepID=A0A1P8JVW2_9BURK|nr:hypothetical protein [Rhodoferax koreense]APW37884.1 hypothetical protein RD110_12310 [Rhodoferax koreense]
MKLSRYFADHSPAYDAEINDLLSDSEGKNVLEKRLREKRGQIDFLVMMMDDSPEMLAVVFHQGFRFTSPRAMDELAGMEPDRFPSWKKLSAAATLVPWAQTLAERVLQEEGGERFMAIAAVLEYLHSRVDASGAAEAQDDEDEDQRDEDADGEDGDEGDEGESLPRNLEEAGADWLAEQGFERKE